jgi:flagellar protein FliS
MSSNSALGHYQAVNAYATAGSDRVQLILKMMNAAVDRIVTAKGCIRRREVAAKGQEIGRAISIIDSLCAALNRKDGGDIAANLEALYDYMMRRLLEANANDDERRLDEVIELLDELRSGWKSINRSASDQTGGTVTAPVGS